MSKREAAVLAWAVRRARKDELAALSDRELLQRYAESADQAAFAALAGRHTAMVLGVCKRALGNAQDAEDACQAVFLVLAKKAKANRWQSSVANWLYATARKVAGNARVASARRARREGAAAVPEAVPPADALSGRELVELLDEELEKLPPRYREPLVLCYLESLTRDEAAARLGVPAGALKGHLERGRKRLADALTARGCTLGVALLATAATSSAGASPLLRSILAAAGGSPSPAAAALAREVAVNGILTHAKVTLLALAGAVALTFGLASGPSAEPEKPPAGAAPAKADPATTLTIRVLDPDGKPVPNATVTRRSRPRFDKEPVETALGKTDAAGRLDAEARPFSLFAAVAEGYAAGFSGYNAQGKTLDLKLAKPLPIKGRLVDLQGRPIAGAKVEVVSVSGSAKDDLAGAYNAFRVNPDWSGAAFDRVLDGKAAGAPAAAVTGKDGRFELKNAGANHVVRLRFLAGGIESSSVHVFADPEFAKRARPATDAEKGGWLNREHKPAVYGPDFTHAARPEHLIVGSVTDAETGKPVPGVEVWGTTVPVSSSAMLSPWGDHAAATADERGGFKLAGLAKAVVYNQPFLPREARRYLHVRAAGTRYLDQLVTVPDAADYTPVRVEVKLRPALVVTGTLVNKATGRPVRGSVKWAALATNTDLAEGKSPAAGLYVSVMSPTKPTGVWREAGDDGRFRLQVPPGPCVLLARADDDDPAAVFTTVRVRDEDRRHLQRPETGEGVVMVGPRDRAGDQAFATLATTWPLRWENGYAVLEPDAKARTADVKIEFDPGATARLSVTGPDGEALGGVTLVGHGKYGRPPRTFATAEVAVSGLDPKNRPEQLYFLHRQMNLCGEVSVKGDEKGKVVAKLRPCAAVTGRVVDAAGKPAAGMRVIFQMTDAVADDLLRQKLFRDEHTTTTGPDGRFTFGRMMPGVEFFLVVSRPGFRSGEAASKPVTLKPGETRDVGELKLRAPKKDDAD